jgi:hypothetical protein
MISYLAQATKNEITYKCVTVLRDGCHLPSLSLKIPKAIIKKRLGKAPGHRKWLPNWSTNSSASLQASQTGHHTALPLSDPRHGARSVRQLRSTDKPTLPLSKLENPPTLSFQPIRQLISFPAYLNILFQQHMFHRTAQEIGLPTL